MRKSYYLVRIFHCSYELSLSLSPCPCDETPILVAMTILHPLDVVRTRRQAKGIEMIWDAPTLLRGIGPSTGLAGPAGALQFCSLEASKKFLQKRCHFGPVAANFVGGAVGAVSASLIRVPQEVLKQGVQAELYNNAGHAVSPCMPEYTSVRLLTVSPMLP